MGGRGLVSIRMKSGVKHRCTASHGGLVNNFFCSKSLNREGTSESSMRLKHRSRVDMSGLRDLKEMVQA